ncbi:MAG: transglutaminase family protein [Caldilineaceae bacterium]
MTIYRISHQTTYEYESAASLSYNEARLLPRPVETPLYSQSAREAQVQVEPGWDDQSERCDFFGNRVLFFSIRQPHEQMVVTATSRVEIVPKGEWDAPAAARLQSLAMSDLTWEAAVAQLADALDADALDARPYILPSPYAPQLAELHGFAQKSFCPERPVLEVALALMEQIFDEFEFVAGATDIATPLTEVLKAGKGVCQDFAHLMVEALRSYGLPARYVSGYIETLPPPGEEKLVGSDASHAWCSLFVPNLGWVDFDPTNNLLPADQHVILGWGRDFGDVTPLKGVFYGPSAQELSVSVDMRRMENL